MANWIKIVAVWTFFFYMCLDGCLIGTEVSDCIFPHFIQFKFHFNIEKWLSPNTFLECTFVVVSPGFSKVYTFHSWFCLAKHILLFEAHRQYLTWSRLVGYLMEITAPYLKGTCGAFSQAGRPRDICTNEAWSCYSKPSCLGIATC